MIDPVTEFQFQDYVHERGPDCGAGWCGNWYPKKCENEGCTGYVHANFGDENYDGDYWLYYKCDTCGDTGAP